MSKNNYIIVVLITIILLLFSSCSNNKLNSNYTPEIKKYLHLDNINTNNIATIREDEPVKFFLQYPGYYEVSVNKYQGEGDVIPIQMYPPSISSIDNMAIRYIGVYFLKNTHISESIVTNSINEYKAYANLSKYNDFKLIEKTRVIVSNNNGWEMKVALIITSNPFNNLGMIHIPDKPLTVVIRQIFIDYKDIVSSIILMSDENNDKQAQSDYEQVVRTFTILE